MFKISCEKGCQTPAQIQALKQKKCSSEVSMMLSRIFTDFERINDHALNVSQELDKITVEIPD